MIEKVAMIRKPNTITLNIDKDYGFFRITGKDGTIFHASNYYPPGEVWEELARFLAQGFQVDGLCSEPEIVVQGEEK